ncbi:MAG: NAD(P)-binding domain-containing protein [Proteobacteria bacterium]|nr:NAD(P)-binding domain-containing protein [Pseudomonadota bacterium]
MKDFAPALPGAYQNAGETAPLLTPAAHNASAPSLRLAPRRQTPVPVDRALPRVCIVGAGASGLALAKTLYEAGVPFDCFDTSERVGGLWAFKNKSGKSAAYRSLHANTSRDRTSYSDFPFPRDWPNFPHHTQLAQYFEAYADWFGFRHRIELNRTVERARQDEDGVWEVTLDGGETRRYDALCVASGQFWNPAWPDPRPPGRFAGLELHSKDYVDPTEPADLRGKRVLVVGFGNSALDIACELGRKENCEMAYISTRRGRWVIPRQFGARVWDAYYPHPALESAESSRRSLRTIARSLAPRRLREWIRLWRLESAHGLPHQHGLPQPDEPYFSAWPVISSELYQRISAGDLAVKPDIASYDGRIVNFTDGSTAEVDAIVYCTGYTRIFPFFEQPFAQRPQDSTSLWMQIVDPDRPNLAFVGFTNPGCAVMPMSEQQAIFVRDMLLGRFSPPSSQQMRQELSEVRAQMEKGAAFPRWYAENIDCAAYVAALRRVARERRARNDGAIPAIRNRPGSAAPAADAEVGAA